MTKLAILEEREEDKYEHVLALRHYRNGAAAATAPDSSVTISVPVEGIAHADQHVRALVDGVMQSLSSARQEEVQAWEEEILPCEHTFTLLQLATGHIPASGACAPPLFLYPRLGLKYTGWGMFGGRKG
jgi:ubiquitin carboxyl-terminal hydrolase 5/13